MTTEFKTTVLRPDTAQFASAELRVNAWDSGQAAHADRDWPGVGMRTSLATDIGRAFCIESLAAIDPVTRLVVWKDQGTATSAQQIATGRALRIPAVG